jgi:hypothetical protein
VNRAAAPSAYGLPTGSGRVLLDAGAARVRQQARDRSPGRPRWHERGHRTRPPPADRSPDPRPGSKRGEASRGCAPARRRTRFGHQTGCHCRERSLHSSRETRRSTCVLEQRLHQPIDALRRLGAERDRLDPGESRVHQPVHVGEATSQGRVAFQRDAQEGTGLDIQRSTPRSLLAIGVQKPTSRPSGRVKQAPLRPHGRSTRAAGRSTPAWMSAPNVSGATDRNLVFRTIAASTLLADHAVAPGVPLAPAPAAPAQRYAVPRRPTGAMAHFPRQTTSRGISHGILEPRFR